MSNISKKTISEKFFDKGSIFFNHENKKNILKVDIKKIKNEFNKKGILLLRNFDLDIKKINQFTDKFTIAYANDAIRRKKRFNKNNIRNVDSGLMRIDLHSEASFSPSVPDIIWFICLKPPINKGGRTTICDGVKLWNSLAINTKEFFLKNLIKYKLSIPFENNIFNKKRRKWLLPYPGVENCFIDYKKSKIEFDYSRYAVNRTRYIDQLAFANHLFVTLKSEPQILKRSLKNGKKIPKKILSEIKNKSEFLTYKHSWNKYDMFMIDNNRFLHGREEISKNDVRDIVIIQTLKAKF